MISVRLRTALILVLLSLSLLTAASGKAGFPRPQGFVSDFASVMSSTDRARLETRLRSFSDQFGYEVSVVTVQSTSPHDPRSYAVRLFEEWGIGRAGEDTGVLLLLAMEERAVEIEVGYGAEPVLTDARAGRILDEYVLPQFRNGQFSTGLIAGADAIIGVLSDSEEYESLRTHSDATGQIGVFDDGLSPSQAVGLILMVLLLFGAAATPMGRRILYLIMMDAIIRNRRGGGFGGGRGGFGGSRGGFGGFGGGRSGGGGAGRRF